MKNRYLARYGYPQSQFTDYKLPYKVDIIVVIPCFKELHLHNTLNCLNQCDTTKLGILVLVVVNESEDTNDLTSKINQDTLDYLNKAKFMSFELKYCFTKLSKKKAGVGLARKIGMDEAVRFFDENNDNGIIACFDADSTSERNYFQALNSYFLKTANEIGLVYYEHPLNGEFKEHITNYELFLRYYTDGLRYAKFPYAYQTLGSCIAVKSDAYQKHGGMSPRQAGEDFYFINKMAMHGKIGEINDTTIFPSSRISDRVPFGTGHAIGNMNNGSRKKQVYNPKIFLVIREFIESILGDKTTIYHDILTPILSNIEFEKHLIRIRKESKNQKQFESRLFQWLDAFKMLKLTHFLDEKIERISLDDALDWLDTQYYNMNLESLDLTEKLVQIRRHNRENKLN